MLLDIPVSVLEPALAEHDARADFGDVRELAASIRELGLLQPIGIRERADLPGMYRVVYGHRRAAACISLGWTAIPAVLVDAEPSEDLLRSLVENIQRRQLSRQERAVALEQLLASGLSGKEIAQRTGKHENSIYSWLKVARSKPLMAALSAGELGINEARVLSSLPAVAVAELIPELQGKPEAFRLARIQRAVDDARTAPPRGFYKANVEGRTKRLLLLIREYMIGIRDVTTREELELVQEIVDIAGKWRRDLQRATSAPP